MCCFRTNYLTIFVNHLSKYLTKCKYFIDTFLSDLYNDNSTFGFDTVSIVYDIYLKAKSMMIEAQCMI